MQVRWTEQAGHSGKGSGGENGEETGESQPKDGQAGQPKDSKPKASPFSKWWVKLAIVVVVLLLIVGGIVWWLIARQYENTDDAFIDTHIVHVSSQISGQVLLIHVTDNQRVRAGQPLLEIDARNQQAQLDQALAQRLQGESRIAQASAQARAADAQVTNSSRDLARYRTLEASAPAAVAQQQLDQAEAAARSAAAQRDAAEGQIAEARAQIAVLDAQIAAARLQLSYAQVLSPVAGHIAQRSVALGNYVTPGQELMAVVPDRFWVTANFKETQLALMRPGQAVRIVLDSCDKAADGHIDSIQRGAGQAFGILPPENATGNYVKVVQRVPVKIVFDHVPDGCILGPGMSVEAQGAPAPLRQAIENVKWLVAHPPEEAGARRLAEQLALALCGVALLGHAPDFVCDAFSVSRLVEASGFSYGAGPCLDLADRMLERAKSAM